MKPDSYQDSPILLVDDEEHFLNSLYLNLRSMGMRNVSRCHQSRDVMPMIREKPFAIILLDILMPEIRGDDLLKQILQESPDTQIIMITASNETELAQDCLKNGAFDYLVKPIRMYQLVNSIRNALKLKIESNENARLRQSILSEGPQSQEFFAGIVTCDTHMKSIFKYIEAIAEFNVPVLITGETGTGKELIARVIHNIYATKNNGGNRNFVSDNVSGWDEGLFSDTLYGHEKGSFTDAKVKRDGLLKEAEGGTLFLDEIGDLSLPLQAKLLRLLQEKQYYPLGADKPRFTNARFIVATNRDLNGMKDDGAFRKDLFFRLNTHHIHLPALRERKIDIPLLVEFFAGKAAKRFNKETPPLPPSLFTLLSNYHFPGNVRELEGMMDDAVSRHQTGELPTEVFMQKIELQGGAGPQESMTEPGESNGNGHIESGDSGVIFCGAFPSFKEMVRIYTEAALKRTNQNQTAAAQLADLARSTFVRYWKNNE